MMSRTPLKGWWLGNQFNVNHLEKAVDLAYAEAEQCVWSHNVKK